MFNKLNIHDLAFWLCLFFLIGVALAALFTDSFYLILILVSLISFYSLLIKKNNLAWLVLFVIVGAIYYQLFSYFQFKNINIPFGKEGEFSGLVESVRGGATQELKVSLIGEFGGDISVKLSPYPEFKYGDLVKISGKINKPNEQYGDYYLSRGIFGEINFPKIELVEKNKGNYIKAQLFSFKERIKDVFKVSLPKEKAAFLAGITIGAREDFSKEFKEKMSLSGTTHLVALSGYNISVIAIAIGFALNSFFSSAVSFYLSALIITLFVLMAGAEASVVRAAIMGTIGLFAVQVERLFNPRNAIVIAAFIMAIFNPGVLVFDIGFQLSFAALLGIVYLVPALKKIFKIETKGFFSWKENAVTTTAAQIMALPILLSNFGFFSIASLLANILILEFIPITMGIGFAMAFLGLFSDFFAGILGVLVNLFISYEFFIINIFSRFSVPLRIEEVGFYFWIIYYLVVFVFIFTSLRVPTLSRILDKVGTRNDNLNIKMKKGFNLFTYIGLFLLAINVVVWYLIIFPRSISGSELYFLSVGQGDSSLLLLPGSGGKHVKFLIDGGPINGGLNSNLEKILGLDKYIDVIFVTHPELDHFGGLIQILKDHRIGAVLYNGAEGDSKNWAEFNKIILEKKIAKIALVKGDGVIYTDSMIKVLHPANLLANSNESGLVLGLETNGFKTLFTADIGLATEKIIAQSEDIKSDILKVGHHGSKYSSGLSFLEKVMPKISVVEVGKNSYGHPTKEAMGRLLLVGSKIFNTYEQGIIKIVKEGGELKVFNL